MKRQVRGLLTARMLSSRPGCIPVGRPRGAKAFGIRYERDIAKALPEAQRGVWFEFCDVNGQGYCEVDFLIRTPSGILILESKYTWLESAHEELETLYLPVVTKALKSAVKGVVVAKALTRATVMGAMVHGELEGAMRDPRGRVVWHFLGGMGAKPQFPASADPRLEILGLATI